MKAPHSQEYLFSNATAEQLLSWFVVRCESAWVFIQRARKLRATPLRWELRVPNDLLPHYAVLPYITLGGIWLFFLCGIALKNDFVLGQ